MTDKKYVIIEAGWDMDAKSFCWVNGPYTYKEAKDMFDCELMMELGIDPNDDSEERADYYRKYGKADKYEDYGRLLLQIKELEE